MRTLQSQIARGAVAAALVLGAAVAPVAAATPTLNRWSDTYTVDHACAILETTKITVNEKAFLDGDTWVRSVVNLTFDGVDEGPTGQTYAVTSHQNGIFTPTTGAISGQGSFLRGAGGVLIMDVGRLVFEIPSGQTIQASAQVLRFDDPPFPNLLDDALCARLG
jgi:hypothetical protein